MKKVKHEIQLLTCPFCIDVGKATDNLRHKFAGLLSLRGIKEKFNPIKWVLYWTTVWFQLQQSQIIWIEAVVNFCVQLQLWSTISSNEVEKKKRFTITENIKICPGIHMLTFTPRIGKAVRNWKQRPSVTINLVSFDSHHQLKVSLKARSVSVRILWALLWVLCSIRKDVHPLILYYSIRTF